MRRIVHKLLLRGRRRRRGLVSPRGFALRLSRPLRLRPDGHRAARERIEGQFQASGVARMCSVGSLRRHTHLLRLHMLLLMLLMRMLMRMLMHRRRRR